MKSDDTRLCHRTHLTTVAPSSYLETGDVTRRRRNTSRMLNLTVAITRNPRFEPLIDGTITSKILNLQFVVTTPPELFYRNLKYDEFESLRCLFPSWPSRENAAKASAGS